MNTTSEYRGNPLTKIIALSVVLSMGFLLVILAGINGNWMPIIDGILFGLCPLPRIIVRGQAGDYDFSFDPSTSSAASAAKEVAEFLSGLLMISALAMPIVLHHSDSLTTTSTWLTEIGGGFIYATVYTFTNYFDDRDNSEEVI
ncbi:vacuolar protein sorting-associated protein 55 [Diutina catenulata]